MTRFFAAILVAGIALSLASSASAGPPAPVESLVIVAESEGAGRPDLSGAGAPVYASFNASGGDFAVAGLTAEQSRTLARAGLEYRILDPDITGDAYYLVYPGASREIALDPLEGRGRIRPAGPAGKLSGRGVGVWL